MAETPIFNLLALAAGAYLFYLWWIDTRENQQHPSMQQKKGMLPGTTSASVVSCLLAAAGAISLVGMVSFLEYRLEVGASQTTISWWFLLAMLGAAVTEEIIFRGYFVIQNRGFRWLVFSVVLFSVIFALIHPYLWKQTSVSPSGFEWMTGLRPQLELQPLLATMSVFVLSLWFYWVRFWPLNPSRSLLPCFSAHAGANLAVFIIKLASGHVA